MRRFPFLGIEVTKKEKHRLKPLQSEPDAFIEKEFGLAAMALGFKSGVIHRLQSRCPLTQIVQKLVSIKYTSADVSPTTEAKLIETLRLFVKVPANPQINSSPIITDYGPQLIGH